jgi:hypothetical protein
VANHPTYTAEVPNELLDMIMLFMVDEDWSCTDVLHLVQVSVLWRNVAERCTKLWCKISVAPPGSNLTWNSCPKSITSLGLLKKYLLHSHQSVLDICIFNPSTRWLEEPKAKEAEIGVRMLLLELANHAGRWMAFELLLEGDEEELVNDLFHLFWEIGAFHSMKMLKRLAICYGESSPHFRNTDSYNIDSSPWQGGNGGFQLTHLRCDASVQGFTAKMLRYVTVLCITHRLSDAVAADFLAVLEHTPGLVDLTVRCHGDSDSFRAAPVQVMPGLRAICFIDSSRPDPTMCCFSAPGLQTLRVLSRSNRHKKLSYSSLLQLMGSEKAMSGIKHLDISGAMVENTDLQKVLQGCISATRIAFSAGNNDQVRTGIFKYIRESIHNRLVGLGEEEAIEIKVAGWTGGGRTCRLAMREWVELQRRSTSDRRFIFSSAEAI